MAKNDLYDRLKLVEKAMISCLPEADLYLHVGYESAHNVGRWVEAALLLENKVGMVIPPKIEKAMFLHFRALTSNPYGMLYNDREVLGGGSLNHHNLRECLLSLAALIRYRGSRWAVHCGERLVDALDRRFFTGTLTEEEMCETLGLPTNGDPMITRPEDDPYREEDYTSSHGRAIEGLLAFWKLTGSAKAKEVMEKAVAFHRVHTIRMDGSTPEWMLSDIHVGHNHSYLGTVRGLLRYGLEFGDAALVEAVYRTYVNSILRHNCSPSGWAPHDLGKLRFPDGLGDPYGDHASCADIAYIAFLLATRGGHPELLDDTERFIRARLFRCQVQAGTEQGAWGTYGGYFGAGVVMDVFALIAGTLAIIYRDSVEEKEGSLWVHLHFSQECEPAQVTAYRDTHQHLNIVPTRAQTVRVRIPGWCDVSTLRVTGPEGESLPYTLEDSYAMIPVEAVEAGRALAVSFPLPVTETVEYTTVSHTGYRLRWKGDEIIQVDELSKE